MFENWTSYTVKLAIAPQVITDDGTIAGEVVDLSAYSSATLLLTTEAGEGSHFASALTILEANTNTLDGETDLLADGVEVDTDLLRPLVDTQGLTVLGAFTVSKTGYRGSKRYLQPVFEVQGVTEGESLGVSAHWILGHAVTTEQNV